MFPLLIPLLLGGGAVLVATQAARGRKRGEGVPPAVTRADPFDGYEQWGDAPVSQSPRRSTAPTAPTRVVWTEREPEATPERASPERGPRRPRRVGPATGPATGPAPRRALPPEREVNALPDEVLLDDMVLDEDGLSDDFNARWARVSRGS